MPAVFQARLDREIPSGSIGAGLATGYNFSKHFEHAVASALQRQVQTWLYVFSGA
jgi:hypothetical protein